MILGGSRPLRGEMCIPVVVHKHDEIVDCSPVAPQDGVRSTYSCEICSLGS